MYAIVRMYCRPSGARMNCSNAAATVDANVMTNTTAADIPTAVSNCPERPTKGHRRRYCMNTKFEVRTPPTKIEMTFICYTPPLRVRES
jgi:hypothetical protein